MHTIYEPKGAALEYAPLALNLYDGCAHGCRYCYAPGCLRRSREAFRARPKPRTGVLRALEREAPRYRDDPREILLSFTSDPYQPIEEELRVTRCALEVLAENRCRVTVLTKNPMLAVQRDGDLFRKMSWRLGVTLTTLNSRRAGTTEPYAPSPMDRTKWIWIARSSGIHTWVSLEPVIEPRNALDVLGAVTADHWRIGKLNHDPAKEAQVDWGGFVREALAVLRRREMRFAFKMSLYPYLPKGWLERHCPECGVETVPGSGFRVLVGGVLHPIASGCRLHGLLGESGGRKGEGDEGVGARHAAPLWRG